jgi:hypothetical protein
MGVTLRLVSRTLAKVVKSNREVMTGIAAFPLDSCAMTAPTRASSTPYGATKGVVDMRSSASRARQRRLRPARPRAFHVLRVASAAQTDRADRPALYDNRESPATPLIVRFFVRSLTASECSSCGIAASAARGPTGGVAVRRSATLRLAARNEQRSA